VKRNGIKQLECVRKNNIRHQMGLLTRSNLTGLVAYARRRLLRIGLDPTLSEDIVQDAFRAILIGLESAKAGRHPRGIDVQAQGAFVDYLGGVINSLVAYEREKRRYRFTFEPMELEPAWENEGQPHNELRSAVNVEGEVGWRDLQHLFFSKLRPQVPSRVQHILADWEQEWQRSAQIPVPIPQRRFRKIIRHLAQEVLAELGEALAA
jgi:hypothetical protein